MLQPRKTKFRKFQKNKQNNVLQNLSFLNFGEYAIKSLDTGVVSAKTIETFRRILTRKLKRTGQIWIRVYPQSCVTRKPAEVRMGKGKGSPSHWIAKIPGGQILFEITTTQPDLVKQAVIMISRKTKLSLELLSRS